MVPRLSGKYPELKSLSRGMGKSGCTFRIRAPTWCSGSSRHVQAGRGRSPSRQVRLVQPSAFHAEAGFRERIAERRLLTLSRPSGDEAYRHEVYRKPVVSVQTTEQGSWLYKNRASGNSIALWTEWARWLNSTTNGVTEIIISLMRRTKARKNIARDCGPVLSRLWARFGTVGPG